MDPHDKSEWGQGHYGGKGHGYIPSSARRQLVHRPVHRVHDPREHAASVAQVLAQLRARPRPLAIRGHQDLTNLPTQLSPAASRGYSLFIPLAFRRRADIVLWGMSRRFDQREG